MELSPHFRTLVLLAFSATVQIQWYSTPQEYFRQQDPRPAEPGIAILGFYLRQITKPYKTSHYPEIYNKNSLHD